MRRRIRAFVVEDTAVTRHLLIRLLEQAGDFEVIGSAADGLEAVEAVISSRPDVVTMGIHLPGLDGIEATRRIVERAQTPVLVVSDSGNVDDRTLFDVLDAGALGLALRPLAPGRPGADERRDALLGELRTTARLSTDVRAARASRARRTPRAAVPRSGPSRPAEPVAVARRGEVAVIGIAASTGGPSALRRLLADLPPQLPPVLVVQHMASGFVTGFAAWLAQAISARVSVAVDGEPMTAGKIVIGPDDRHLVVDAQRRIRLVDSPPVNGHRPSADILFTSLAERYGAGVLGIVLTGMGSDGAEGLGRIRRAGGTTLAQDQGSSVVYGMPAVAADRGAVQHVVPLESLGEVVGEHIHRNGGGARAAAGHGRGGDR